MTPKKHYRYLKLTGLAFFIASLVIFFVNQADSQNTQTGLTIVRNISLSIIVVSACFAVALYLIRAKCEKCGSPVTQHFRKTTSYECEKCGWVFDTGEAPPAA